MNSSDNKSVYQGTVVSQILTETRDGDPQLRLGVQLTGKCIDCDVSNASAPLPEELQVTKTVYFNFRPTPDALERTFRDLRTIGFESASIEFLDSSHPKMHSFVGTVVFLKPRYVPDPNGGERDWWNIYSFSDKAGAISSDSLKRFKELNGAALAEGFSRSASKRSASRTSPF